MHTGLILQVVRVVDNGSAGRRVVRSHGRCTVLTNAVAAIEIATPRTHMRELRHEDVERLGALANDPEVTRWVHWPLRERAELEAFASSAIEARTRLPRVDYVLGADAKYDSAAIGFLRLHVMSVEHEQAELSVYLLRSQWGAGFATECGAALVSYAFSQLRLRRVFAYCDVDNLPSARVLEKIGFAREGTLRSRMKLGGTWRDSHLYAIVTQMTP